MNPSDRVWRECALRTAVLAGDARAWQTWYDESFAALAAYVAWRCAGLSDLRDEITQETWLTAVKRIRSFDPERACFATWLRGIAANLLRNHFRGQQRRDRHKASLNGLACPVPSAGAALERTELAEKVAHILTELPERYEAVLRAKYLDQMSVAEIASQWNETPKSIESLLSRARQAFRPAFEKQS
jgi:RNA polymerase sigma-70 factor (ECF subfamily)